MTPPIIATATALDRAMQHRIACDYGLTPSSRQQLGPRVTLFAGDFDRAMTLTPHTDPRFVMAHRAGGGHYATDGETCQCPARWHPRCCHRDAVRTAGGVAAIRAAFDTWRAAFRSDTARPPMDHVLFERTVSEDFAW